MSAPLHAEEISEQAAGEGRRQGPTNENQLEIEAGVKRKARSKPPKHEKAIANSGEGGKTQKLLQLYSVPTSDGSPGVLNNHVFGDVPLIYVDFNDPKVAQLFSGNKQPDGKGQVYHFQLEKLRVMLHFYSRE